MTDHDPLRWLAVAAAERQAAGLHRVVVPRVAGSTVLDLASNDYLGLARDPRVIAAGQAALAEWGAGATGSRLVTGTTELHVRLESELAELVGAPSALVFSSGYLANLAAVTALSGPDCLIVSDAGNHASLVDACRLSRSPVVVTPHGDLAAIGAALAGRTLPRALLVVDAIHSADGDLLPLADLHAVAGRYGALLVIDDAHGVGVRGGGRGSVFEAGLAGRADVVTTVTLSKALGAQGGAVLGAAAVTAHLADTARPFVFDTGLNPAAVGAALAAVRIVSAEPALAAAVLARAAELARICGIPVADGAVLPVLIGSARAAAEAAADLLAGGVRVGCFRPPSVPTGTARLRITARADLTDIDLNRFCQTYRAWSAA